MNYKGSAFGLFTMLVLLVLLGISAYLLYYNLPGEPIDYVFQQNASTNGEIIEQSQSEQFYPNMRFKSSRISYKIESACDSVKRSDVERAFEILESQTALDFYFSNSNPEIRIFCSDIEPEPNSEGYFVAGEGGPSEVINTSLYNVILSGKVSFFRDTKCSNPNVALHEILHVLGFDHNNNPQSILYPTLDCDQEIDKSIIDDINYLYSIEALPDLEIVKVEATKSGRYLSFNIEVLNQGLDDAEDVSLGVYADNELVQSFDLNDINLGVKKYLEVTNLRISRSSNEVSFYVDYENEIMEISENNNNVELTLAS